MEPKIRKVIKSHPPWPLNEFPATFANCIGREIIARLAADHTGAIEGETWEQMFAVSLGVTWKPSSAGHDDVVLGDCAWSAKTLKNSNPFTAQEVRLISGRNDPGFSYGRRPKKPGLLGDMVLGIWNERVDGVKKTYRHARSVVLIKPSSIDKEWLDFAIYEFDIVKYEPKEYEWSWNENKNLIGTHRGTKAHVFTWQPHGAQFTIIHRIPEARLKLQVKKPPRVETSVVLGAVKYDDSWIKVL